MITVVSGTNRPNSLTYKFSMIYFNSLLEKHEKAQLFDLKSLPSSALNTDVYEKGKKPEEIMKIQTEIFQPSEKFIFIFPEYNGSFPGVLKLLIDVLDPKISFAGKKASLIGISTGRAGNLRGMDHLASIMHHMNVQVLPFLLPVSGVHNEMDFDSFKEQTKKNIDIQIDRILAF